MTITDVIARFMEEQEERIATLPQIYKAVYESWEHFMGKRPVPAEETIRAAIYKPSKGHSFERIGSGIYLLQGEKSSSLLIHGDSRKLEEIGDEVIDCIITDHPWCDKKAHLSGNQKGFAEYDTFEYTLEDFKAKARVLKNGAFLAEFLPVESATNWKYLTRVKQLAEEAGFKYYCQTIWRKAPEGSINTGRTTKGVEQIIIFSKGNPRRLAPKGKPYMTANMLSYEIDIPANKGKDKMHQAEKPLPLYEYLITNLTEETEVCLDQFGGACNMVQAAVHTNRFGIVYELCQDFVSKAIERFQMVPAFHEDIAEDTPVLVEDLTQTETFVLETIPNESTLWQYDYLKKVASVSRQLLSDEDLSLLAQAENDPFIYAVEINDLFNCINEQGYSNYNKPRFDLLVQDYIILQEFYPCIQEDFETKFKDPYTRSAHLNYKYEAESYAEYAVTQKRVTSYESLKNENLFRDYMSYIAQHYPNLNHSRIQSLVHSFIAAA